MVQPGQPQGTNVDASQISEQIARDVARSVQEAMRDEGVRVETQNGRQVLLLPNGKRIIFDGDNINVEGVPAVASFDEGDPVAIRAIETGKQITLFVCMALAFIIVGLPIARAFARWLDRRGTAPAVDANTAARLAAIETAIDSVAVEVERISEGQRFTTRLLNERAAERVAERVG